MSQSPIPLNATGRTFHKQCVYHYSFDVPGRDPVPLMVGIVNWCKSGRRAIVVRVAHTTKTFLGKLFPDALPAKIGDYIQVHGDLGPLELSKFGDPVAGLTSLPDWLYERKRKGAWNLAYKCLKKGTKTRKRSPNDSYRYINAFSGCGVSDQGYKQEGFQCMYAIDTDGTALATLKCNSPEIKTYRGCVNSFFGKLETSSDFREKLGQPDALNLSPVCTAYSTRNHNLEMSEDDRANAELLFSCVRGLNATRAPMMVLENVPGLFSQKGIGYISKLLMDLILTCRHFDVFGRR
jgi:hypothetical protein